jgi:hypothetical protein
VCLQKPQWAQQFKIDDTTWANLCSESANKNVTPLDTALDKGLLNENKLILWDRQNSGLPSITAVFFNAQPPFAMWEKQDFSWCRKHACLPLGEWDGHTYWAKLSGEPIETPPGSTGVIWVLAPWTGLKKWFSQWEAKVSASKEASKNQVQEIDIPQSLKLDGLNELTGITQTKSTKSSLEDMMPTGLSLDGPVGLNLNAESDGPVGLSLPPPVMATPIMTPPAPPPPAAMPAMQVAQPTTTSIPTIPVDQLLGRLKMALNQEELAMSLMGAWQNYFSKVMILLFQNNQLIIWRWNGLWKGQVKTGDVIPLDTPSIFKIVADTGTPYHGYVSAGPINDRFFQQTDGGQYPEHLSIIPVVAQSRVVAMLFGTCTKDAGRQLILGRLEEHGNHFASALMRLLNPVQKAG